MLGHRVQAALLELGLDLRRIPLIDDEGERLHRDAHRTAASASAVPSRRLERLGRDLPEDGGSPVAHVQHGLLAVIAPELPAHERDVEGGLLAVVRDPEGEVVERHRLPAGRFEDRLDLRRVAGRRAEGQHAATLRG